MEQGAEQGDSFCQSECILAQMRPPFIPCIHPGIICFCRVVVAAAGQRRVPGSPGQLGAGGVVYGARGLPAALHDARHRDQQEVPQLLRAHHRAGARHVIRAFSVRVVSSAQPQWVSNLTRSV